MKYRVVVTTRAKDDLRGYFEFAAKRAPQTAAKWLSRFENELAQLAIHPRRCGLAPEDSFVSPEIRQLLFGKRPNVSRAVHNLR